ncbi:MAG: undecaprenyldiphospho-muramoylpentapeptide beta-N-acetylglucosaminyltransferase [Cellvibrionales bacterium]|nr:undecaprenyldiphospho-muramoylpentapeptide beta-N-acetylglucosaminyltransferase [Cellvibrionales bacterium]
MNSVISRQRRALIMAGGTGGHVFPALAVAKILQQRGWQVEWLGTENGIEARVAPTNHFKLHCITAVGLRGKSLVNLLVAPLYLMWALCQSLRVLFRYKPDVVLGMGGFASAPGGVSAFLLRIPLVIHEQNAVAGTTNRLLSALAGRVLSAFPSVFKNGEPVGNPVRDDIAALLFEKNVAPSPDQQLRLFVLGGSQGARALNNLLPSALALLPDALRPEIFHQAGNNLLDETRNNDQQAGVAARIEPFVDDMASMYRWADLAVCRAGAMTVSELACAQLPALLIPLPSAIDDHQTANAQWLVDAGAARLLPQATLTAEKLAADLRDLIENRNVLEAMSHAMKSLAKPESANVVADICESASLKNNGKSIEDRRHA